MAAWRIAMPNLTLLSVLAFITAGYFGCMWITRMINDRGDDILTGLLKGVPVRTKDRWLMLYTNWLPYVALQIAFLLILGFGILELAQGAESPKVGLIGYMSATMCAFGATFWLVIGSFVFMSMVSTLRQTKRD
jgi:hypothetical protein